jgi:3-methyladenine DNA glycosylase AlkC
MDEAAESAPLLKEIFNRQRFQHIAREAVAVAPDFDTGRFMTAATRGLDDLGIMQRMRQGAAALKEALDVEYEKALHAFHALAPRIGHSFASLILPEYVAIYGQKHFDLSMEALKYFTRFGTSEAAIRPFLQNELERTLAVMRGWADDENEHVRRLASEGCRPRLPWSPQLKAVIENPELTWPILDALRADDSAYVRKSVANHLNDIGKDHPDWLIARLEAWPRDDPRTAWIVKHALRTLVKKGDPRALALIGASGKTDVRVEGFSVSPSKVKLGSHVTISAEIVSTSSEDQRLVADYAVHYVKANGGTSRKVFKLKAFDLPAGAKQALSIKRAIRDFTTRKHYPGLHKVELMVNGKTVAEGQFDLTV